MNCQQIIICLLFISFLQQTVSGSLIADGTIVADDDMQYMVSVRSMGKHICGGFLINERFVLTAAKCIDKDPESVCLGSHDLSKKKQELEIIQNITHPGFKEKEVGDNLMLLKMEERATLGDNVKIVQLPEENMKVEVDEKCEVAGWGSTSSTDGHEIVEKLRKTEVSIMSISKCKEIWTNLPHNVFCADRNGGTRTFNEGDWGGPLVCKNTAVGIMSFNRNTEKEGPNVFVDISKYLQWIKETIDNS